MAAHHRVHDYACCHLQSDCLECGISSGPLHLIMSMGNLYLLLHSTVLTHFEDGGQTEVEICQHSEHSGERRKMFWCDFTRGQSRNFEDKFARPMHTSSSPQMNTYSDSSCSIGCGSCSSSGGRSSSGGSGIILIINLY